MSRVLLSSIAALALVLCLAAGADAAAEETIEKTLPAKMYSRNILD